MVPGNDIPLGHAQNTKDISRTLQCTRDMARYVRFFPEAPTDGGRARQSAPTAPKRLYDTCARARARTVPRPVPTAMTHAMAMSQRNSLKYTPLLMSHRDCDTVQQNKITNGTSQDALSRIIHIAWIINHLEHSNTPRTTFTTQSLHVLSGERTLHPIACHHVAWP